MNDDEHHFRIRKRHLRSRVTNGKQLLAEADGNSEWTRRYRDLIGLHASDRGGAELLSEGQKQLIRRIATLELQCEVYEATMSRGEDLSLQHWDMYNRLAGNLRRLLETLGVERVSKEINPIVEFLKGGKPAE
jgi:hypothetical protein